MIDIHKPAIWFPAVRAGSGADVFTQRLAAALIRRGHRTVISWYPHWSEFAPDLLRFERPPEGVDVVHVNSGYAFAFGRRGVPLVATEHHYVLDPTYRRYKSLAQHLYHRALLGPYLRRSYAFADAITTDSRFTANVLKRFAGVQATCAIPLWVDYDRFSPAPDGGQRSDKRFRLLFVGNASRRKGADVIPLLAGQLGRGFEIRCTAGLRADNQGPLGDNVVLLGRLTETQLISEYRSCDAVLVPSRYEGFGYSALEAMACGKPVVGFRCGAVDEVVVEGETGLLCDIDDTDALEASCRRLADNRSLAVEYGRAGRSRATSVFTEEQAVGEYLNVYRSVLANYTAPKVKRLAS
jgi:glycosyltransferase involved in cell wall biosynthesis